MRYSVVVPTRDRAGSLERCLRAVAVAAPGAEVIVVDDGSLDESGVAAVARRHGADVVRIAQSGAAAARNAGARRSTARIVLFTDDDCVPRRGWGESLAAAVDAAPARTIVGGRTEPGSRSVFVTASQSVVATVERATGFRATSNVGCHRETVLEIPFDESFVEASGEDRDWCARVVEKGGSVTVEPRAVVSHLPLPGARAFWRRHARYGRGVRRLGSQTSIGSRARLASRVVCDGFGKGVAVGVAVVVAQLATLAGYLGSRRI